MAKPKHGLCGTRTYKNWQHMMQRCYDPRCKSYKDYGGRGIRVCKRWHNVAMFFKDMGHKPDGHTLGRIDNDGNYSPSNCEWQTRLQQNNNKRVHHKLTLNGKTQNLSQWARETGISFGAISRRLRAGWSVADALTIPVGTKDGRIGGFKTHCLRGHPMEPPNLLISRSGGRRCRECYNARKRKQNKN